MTADTISASIAHGSLRAIDDPLVTLDVDHAARLTELARVSQIVSSYPHSTIEVIVLDCSTVTEPVRQFARLLGTVRRRQTGHPAAGDTDARMRDGRVVVLVESVPAGAGVPSTHQERRALALRQQSDSDLRADLRELRETRDSLSRHAEGDLERAKIQRRIAEVRSEQHRRADDRG